MSSVVSLIAGLIAGDCVTLEGEVDVWRQREDAERAVRHLAYAGESTISSRCARTKVTGRQTACIETSDGVPPPQVGM
jgi:hypothetical protein